MNSCGELAWAAKLSGSGLFAMFGALLCYALLSCQTSKIENIIFCTVLSGLVGFIGILFDRINVNKQD